MVIDFFFFAEVANEVFYLINFQTLCVTDDGHYLPAEIAVIEYSVRRGVSKKLHRFIEPGNVSFTGLLSQVT